MRKISLFLLAVLISSQLAITLNYFALAQEKQRVIFNFLNTGTPDEYGNHIRNVTVYQDTSGTWVRYYNELGGTWEDRGSLNYSTYSANADIEGILNQTTRFDVVVYLNYTWADDFFDMEYRTRVYISVTGEFSDYAMNYYDVRLQGTDYWAVYYRFYWDRPEVEKIYDVRFNYYAGSEIIVNNEQDLTHTTGGDVYRYAGTDGNPISRTAWGGTYKGYSNIHEFLATGFTPLHTVSAFTITMWISWEQAITGESAYLISQDIDATHRMILYLHANDFKLGCQMADGSSVVSTSHSTKFETYQQNGSLNLYHIVLSWDKTNNSGKVDLWVNGTLETSATGLTGNLDCNDELVLGDRDPNNDRFFIGRYFHVSIYDKALNRSEATTLFNQGVGTVLDYDLNNSWSFDEVEFGYSYDEPLLHDALGVFSEREQWDIDFVSQSVASYEFFWWGKYPNEYLWLVAIVGFISVPVFVAWYVKNSDSWWELGVWQVVFIGAVLTLIFFTLVYGLTPTP